MTEFGVPNHIGLLPRLARVMIGILVAVNVWIYSAGYRLTADDVLFHSYLMKGWDELWRFTGEAARLQGRVGWYLIMPADAFGAYVSDMPAARAIMALLNFLPYFLFARFLSILLNRNYTAVLVVAYLAVQPLLFSHTTPTAYPLHNSIPFLLILLSRLYLLNAPEEWSWPSIAARIALFTGCLISEYGFLLGVSILILEYGMRGEGSAKTWIHSRIAVIRSLRFRLDVLVILAALGIYVAYRAIAPSQYIGNQIGEIGNWHDVVRTLAGQSWYGTIFPYLEMGRAPVPLVSGLFAAVLACVACAAVLSAPAPVRLPSVGWLTAVGLLALCLFVSMLPIAMVERYQDWCLKSGECAYLSSRVALFHIVPALVLTLINVFPSSDKIASRISQIALACVLAVLTGWGMLANLAMADRMRDYVRPFEMAQALACAQLADPVGYADLIDPQDRISMHPDFDRANYWARYVGFARQHVICWSREAETEDEIVARLFPRLETGAVVRIASAPNAVVLRSGWSTPEDWGTWSLGAEADLVFRVPEGLSAPSLVIEASVFARPGQYRLVSIHVDDVLARRVWLSSAPGVVSVRLPQGSSPPLGPTVHRVRFEIGTYPTPQDLYGSGDTRPLGIGLISVTLKNDAL